MLACLFVLILLLFKVQDIQQLVVINRHLELMPVMPFVRSSQVSIHQVEVGGQRRNLLVMKGAPERIIDRCATIFINGEEVPITSQWKDAFQGANDDLGALGERVLGFSDLLLPAKEFPIGYEFNIDEENFPLSG